MTSRRSLTRHDFLKMTGAGLAGASLLGAGGRGGGDATSATGGGDLQLRLRVLNSVLAAGISPLIASTLGCLAGCGLGYLVRGLPLGAATGE